jgi:hypothetical protein
MLQKLTTPFLLRRLIEALESQNNALERIANVLEYNFGRPGATIEEYGDVSDDDLTYSSDRATYEQRERDNRRVQVFDYQNRP